MAIVNRLLAASEAHRLTDFVRHLYGDSYPNDLFYSPTDIANLIDEGRLFCSVAERDHHTLVGHLATYFEQSDYATADAISGMVDPEERGNNIMSTLAGPMFEMYQQRQIAGLHLYSVTLHTISQRVSADGGAVITGLLTHDWPGQYQVAGFDKGIGLNRMPMVTMYMPFYRDRLIERSIFSPPVFDSLLQSVYQQLDYPRLFGQTPQNPRGSSSYTTIEKSRQGAATLRFTALGVDTLTVVEHFTQQHVSTAAIYIDLPLTQPGCHTLGCQLLERGWYFGALLPERCNTDFLRLQLRSAEPGWDQVPLIPEVEPFLRQMQ